MKPMKHNYLSQLILSILASFCIWNECFYNITSQTYRNWEKVETTLQRIETSWISYLFQKFARNNVTSLTRSHLGILFTLKVFLATVCDTIRIRRRSVKTVERFITRKTNDIVTVYIVAVIDTGRNMENCFRKTYRSLLS